MKTWQVYRQRLLNPTWQAFSCCLPGAPTTPPRCCTERRKSRGKHAQGGWFRYAWPVVCLIDKLADTTGVIHRGNDFANAMDSVAAVEL